MKLSRRGFLTGAGALDRFKSTRRYDSKYHQRQHGFL